MRCLSFLLHVVIFVLAFGVEVSTLEARLVLPPVVRAGTTATFLCLYDLGGGLLYSVKWYRGRFEFFRYVPSEHPPAKVFTFRGIYVDVYSSDEHQVTLRNIPVHLSGEITCEITREAPFFSTSVVSANLTVVELDIQILVPRRHLHIGDTLTATCKALSSVRNLQLSFQLNSKRINSSFVDQGVDEAKLHLNMTHTELETQRLAGGELYLRCYVSLEHNYYMTSQAVAVHLEEPVPQPSRAVCLNLTYLILLVSIVIALLFLP